MRRVSKFTQYSSGFIHSKTFVADDEVATIGTANLDYRSLYLHFECGVCLYKTDAVMELKEDFLKTLQSCQQITEKDCPRGFFKALLQDFSGFLRRCCKTKPVPATAAQTRRQTMKQFPPEIKCQRKDALCWRLFCLPSPGSRPVLKYTFLSARIISFKRYSKVRQTYQKALFFLLEKA